MAKRGILQTRAEYVLGRSLLAVLGILPRPVALNLGVLTGRLGYILAGRLRRTGERNLGIAFPELSPGERQKLLRESFESLGRMLAEFSQFPKLTVDQLRGLIEYSPRELDYVRQAEEKGRGIIFLTGHIGSWEILSFGWSALEYPISFLVRPLDNPLLEELVERTRTRFGNRAIDKKSAAKQALRLLREGGTLGILSDLNTQEFEGVFVPFFGKLACTTAGIATLALKTDAAVIPTWAIWDRSKGRYCFHAAPALEVVRTGDHKKDVEVNTGRFAAAVEKIVRAYPDQWLWIHKRWKTRPPGEADLYE